MSVRKYGVGAAAGGTGGVGGGAGTTGGAAGGEGENVAFGEYYHHFQQHYENEHQNPVTYDLYQQHPYDSFQSNYFYNVAPEPISFSQAFNFEQDKFLVFDIGSASTKIGYAGEKMPRMVFDSVGVKVDDHRWAFGKEAVLESHNRAKIPMEWGIIRDWEAWEELVSHCFMNLNETPSEQPVFLTEPQKISSQQREKVMETMFEMFDVPAFYTASEVLLSLYSSFCSSGTVVHIGDGTTDIVPFIYAQGQFLQHAACSHELAGRDVTEYLMMLLGRDRGYSFYTKSQLQLVKDIKENSCYLSMDFVQDFKRSAYANSKFFSVDYQLPNRQFVTIGAERFIAPEILFKPFIDAKGIAQTFLEVVQKCDVTIRPTLYKDIVLTGGATMTKGFKERFEKDLRALVPNAPINIHDTPDRHLLGWQGASMIANFPSFNQTMWVSRREYDENGPSIVHRKCALK